MPGFVYILKSSKNGRYYIGSTNNLERRIKEHSDGEAPATKYLRPLSLVFSQCFTTIEQARLIESKLKRFKSKKIIEKIISDGIIYVGA